MRKIFTLISIAILLAANTQLQAQDSFTALNGIPGGQVNEVHKDSNGNLYTVIPGEEQIYISSDNGSTWELFDVDDTGIYAFYADGTDLYYFTYGDMFKSTDGGTTWIKVNSGFASFANIRKAHKSPVDPATWIVEGPCEGVYISTDDGVTWTNIVTETCGSGNDGRYELSIANNGDIYFENYSSGIFRHKYPGDGVWNNNKLELVFAKQAPGLDYALRVLVSGSGNVVISHRNSIGEFRLSSSSTGNNGSFSELSLPVTTTNLDNSVISRGFNGNIYLTSYFENEMYELTDENTPTWLPKTHPLTQYATDNGVFLKWFSANEVYACSNLSGLFRSLDGGSSWQMANGSGDKSLNYGWASDIEVLPNGNIVAFPQYAPKGLWVSTDQGATFSFNLFGEESRMRDNGNGLTRLQDNSLIMSNEVGMLRSTDGINWSVISAENAPLFLPVGSSNIYFIRDGQADLFRTTLSDITDGSGITLETVAAGLPNNSFVRNVILHDNDIYIDLFNNTNGQWELWKVETSVSPFTSQKLILPFTIDESAGLASVGGKLYISNRNQVAYSSNQGATWASINYIFHERLLGLDQEGGGIAIAYRGAVAITQDDGQTWTTKSLPTPQGLLTSLARDAAGNFIAGMNDAPVSKFEGKLVLGAGELPTPINIAWQELNGPFGGTLDGLAQDSQGNIYGYSFGQGGLYKLPSDTTYWESLDAGLVENRIVHFADNDDMYVASYNRIAKSSDGGITWSLISDNQAQDIVNLLVANNGNIIATSTEGGEGLYVSQDNGSTFSKPLGNGSKGRFYELIKSGSGRLWTHQRNNGASVVYTSVDNGLTWTPMNTFDPTGNERVLSITKLEGNAVAIVTDSQMLRSTDDGATWTSIQGSINLLEAYPRDPGSRVYLAPDNSYYFYNFLDIYKSTDQGGSWTQQGTISGFSGELYDFEFRGSDIIACTNWGAVRSINGTANWSGINDNLTAAFRYQGDFLPVGSSYYASPVNNGVIFRSTDDGQSFTKNANNEGYFDGIIKDPNGRLIRYGAGVSFSDDNGETWGANSGSGFYIKIASHKNESTGVITYYAYRDNSGTEFVKSSDLLNWSTISATGFPFDSQNLEDFIALDNDVLLAHGYNNQLGNYFLFRIAFGSSEIVTSASTGANQKLQFNPNASDPANANELKKTFLIYGSNGTMLYSEDGVTWEKAGAPPAENGQEFSISENGYYFINDRSTDPGQLWVSKDEGLTWQATTGFTNGLFDVDINPSNGYAYAVAPGRVLLKSTDIILDNDGINPAFATSSSFVPSNGALDIPQFLPSLTVEFDEIVNPVSGKKIRLLEINNPSSPVKEYDATEANISVDGKTASFSFNDLLDYSTEYFVSIDAGSFTDIFGNPAPGISSNTVWSFTTQAAPDNSAPNIIITTSDLTYEKGTPKVFEINVTDNIEVDALGAKIYYRKISDAASVSFSTADMTASGNDAPNLNFSVSSLESWFDAIGLEFYFEVADKAGNVKRSPDANNAYYYSYIDYSKSPSKVEGLSFGETERSYRIMAMPYDLIDAQISTQFSALGEANKENFRIGTYNNAKQDFDEYPETLTTIGRGRGYWVLMRNFVDIEPANASAPENNRDNFFRMSLDQGWNQIGNPYPVPISWEAARSQNTNVGELKIYSNGSFSNGDVLQPYQGGFVFASANVTDLVIRFQGITTGGRIAGKSYDLAAEDWQMPIAVSQGEFTNAIGGIGMAPEATVGKDRFDDFNPPTITHRLELQFDNADAAPLAKSIVKTEESHAWSFTAYTGGSEMVSLTWDNGKFGDNDIGIWLYDEERVAFVDMRANNEYKYLAKAEKRFKLYYGELPELEVAPSFSLLGEPWPNPASGKLNIPFAINAEHGPSEVVINIFDAQGRLVKEITNQTFDPGTHQLEWLPNRSANQLGLHLIQWNMITEKGDRLQETKRVLVK